MHYRAYFENHFLGAWDLDGREYTVKIVRVVGEEVTGQGGRKTKKPVVYLKGTTKGFLLNKTNAKTIAAMYGNDTAGWIDKLITVYPTTTTMGDETVDAVRVRPIIPTRKRDQGVVTQQVDPEMREKQNRAAAAIESAPIGHVEQEPSSAFGEESEEESSDGT